MFLYYSAVFRFRELGGIPTTAGIGPVSPRLMSLYHRLPGPKNREERTVKRALCWGFTGFLAAAAGSMKYYALELRGGSRVFSLDPPVRKGRVLLFHGYPDGTYMSLAASEVEKVSSLEAEPPKSEKLAPGETIYVGDAVEGPGYELPPAPRQADVYVDSGYGYTDYYWGGGYVPPPRPPVPPPFVPSRIGPNGYPILAPPGTPGSVPPRIGANGYPILAPPPVAPRRP
jgi:hypothetical protein